MKPYHILFPLLVFLGGCSFGPSSSVIKMAYEAGFAANDVVMSQYLFGWMMMAVLAGGLFAASAARKKAAAPKLPRAKNVIGIGAVGISIALVSTCYIFALQTVPAHIAVILLFQYTWIDIILEALYTRKLPHISIVTSVLILVAGTLLAAGVGAGAEHLDPIGILFGIGSAFFYAIYIFLLGKVDVEVHPITRSFCILSFALLFLICIFTPAYFTSGVLADGLWKYGILIGILGCAIPSFFFAIGTPKISTGAATILSSSELPAGIICSVIILSEAVTPLQWAGVVLLFFGIAFPYLWEWVANRRRVSA
ncbi:EamA family transporter [Methanocorpusculum sp.]|nr:EamA family transporter [Methanocorpusculum sp.]